MKPDNTFEKANPFILAQPGFLFQVLCGILIPLCGFNWLAEAIRHGRNMPWDTAILKFLEAPLTAGADQFLSLVARSGDIHVIVVLGVLGVFWLKSQWRMRDAFFLTLAVIGVVVVDLWVRAAVQRIYSSWQGAFSPTFESGFPSSQAADTFAIVYAFGVLTWATRWRRPVVALGAFYVLAVGLARIHLGRHYPSDILAGWELALAWVTTVSLVRRIPSKAITKASKTEGD